MNFVPKMDQETLVNGYKQVIGTVYSPKQYYQRVKTFLQQYRPQKRGSVSRLRPWHVRAFLRSVWFLGVVDRGRWAYWRFFVGTLVKRPRSFPISMTFAIHGFHFQRIARQYTRRPA